MVPQPSWEVCSRQGRNKLSPSFPVNKHHRFQLTLEKTIIVKYNVTTKVPRVNQNNFYFSVKLFTFLTAAEKSPSLLYCRQRGSNPRNSGNKEFRKGTKGNSNFKTC